MGLDTMILIFWILSFKSAFAVSSFTFITSLFSAIRVVSSSYMRLLVFLPVILIPAYGSSSSAFHMMYYVHKLNMQGDNIQPWCTPFPILNQSLVPGLVLIVVSWPAYRFHRWWSGIPICLRIFQFVVIHTDRGLDVVNEAEANVFLEFSCVFMIQWMLEIWSLVPLPVLNLAYISVKFLVHILLKPNLKDFEHYFASMWNECSCAIVWTFFGTAFGIGMKTHLF